LVERHPNSADEREKLMMWSINLSGQSLGDDKFLPFVIDQFHRSGLDASKICFEITETAAVASFSQANRFVQALKELGCKFALDDFGTAIRSIGRWCGRSTRSGISRASRPLRSLPRTLRSFTCSPASGWITPRGTWVAQPQRVLSSAVA